MSQVIRDFKKLSPVRQAAIVAMTAWNLWLSAAAQRDLQRRRPDEVRGSKAFWRGACLTNTVGPIAYFRWGAPDTAERTVYEMRPRR